jgi:hypothetical protein
MIKDKLREELEAAYVEGLVLRCGEGFRDTALYSLSEKKPNGDYQHYTDGIAWWAWQASRETLVIELPKAWQTNVGAMLTPNGVRFAIEAASLKVAP